MRTHLGALVNALGRRETLKYLTIAAVGAAVAPLTGCSGSTLAFKSFAAGTWEVTFPSMSSWPSLTVDVKEDGTWEATSGDDTGSGTWTVASTSLTIAETGNEVMFMGKSGSAGGTGIPEEIKEDEFPASFEWTYLSSGFSVPVTWDSESKTLTLTGTSADDAPFPIVAVKG